MRTAALSSPRKDVDMTQDYAGAAPMLGSQPMAWAVMYPNGKGVDTVFEYESDAREAACGDEEVVPLYRAPMLADEEREAIEAILGDPDLVLGDAREPLRDQFAAAALSGMLARPDIDDEPLEYHFLCEAAYRWADAMLRHRNEPPVRS